MALHLHTYLFADDGLWRLSRRLIDGLVSGSDAMPQYAGTKQKVATVVVETTDGKPSTILKAEGWYFSFDRAGKIRDGLRSSAIQAMNTYYDLEQSKRTAKGGEVVDLAPKLNRQRWERENRWELSKDDVARVSADIMKQPNAPKIQWAKGIAVKRPPLTHEARYALTEISTQHSPKR